MNLLPTEVKVRPQTTVADMTQPKRSGSVDLAKSVQLPDAFGIHFGAAQGASSVKEKDFIQDMQQRGAVVLGGAGIMGNGIILNHIAAGIPAYLYDMNEAAVASGLGKIDKELQSASTPRKPGQETIMTAQEAAEARARVKGTLTDLAQVDPKKGVNPGIVIEAVFESMDLKKKIFKQLDEQLHPDTILATNTSSLSVAEMAKATKRPDKVVGIHFFKPANRNRFVEVIPGPETSKETTQKAMALVRALGKTPIVCGDAPGFVVNRVLIPAMNEGVKMLDEGLANSATIEQAFMETMWPNAHRDPQIAKKLLGPFGGQNQDNYILIIGQTTQVLHNGLKNLYGDAYQPTKTVKDKLKAYQEAMDRSKANGTPLDKELETVRYKLEGPVDEAKKLQARDRFLGLVFGVATQLVEEGVTSAEDVDRGVQAALKWEIGLFDTMNKMGPAKALALVEAYAKTNPGFKVPEILKKQAKLGKPFELSLVDSRKDGSTMTITFNRPQAHGLNYLSPEMLENLRTAFRKAENDPTVKQIVFESVGGKAFISGADIFGMGAALLQSGEKLKKSKLIGMLPRAQQKQVIGLTQYLNIIRGFIVKGGDVMSEIANSKKVTISKVNGLALGGGLELPLACDYIVASDKVKVMGLPETKYGIFPAWGGTERLATRIGGPLSRWMVLEGGLMGKGGKGPAILTAQEAKEIGLVDEIVPALDLDRVVQEKIDAGVFSQKRNGSVPSNDKVLAKLTEKWAKRHERYNNASLKDLAENELKGLYVPGLKLADERVQRTIQGVKTGRIQREVDLFRMAQNMDGADRAAKKAAAEKKGS